MSRGEINEKLLAIHNFRLYTKKEEMKRMYGDRIRMFRQRKGMSQQALGEMLGISATAVHKWEHGQSQPDIVALKRMSDIFGVTIDELCDHKTIPSAQEADNEAERNIAVMTRAFRHLTAEEQKKFIAVGRALFDHAFAEERDT